MITSLSQNPIIQNSLQRYRKDWRFAAGIILAIASYSPLLVTVGYAVFTLLAVIIGAIILFIGSLIAPYLLDAQQAQALQSTYEAAFAQIINLNTTDLYFFVVELHEATEEFLSDGLPLIARGVFYASVALLLLLLILFAPITTTALISGERQRQTLDVLRITLLSPFNIIIGKLTTGVIYLLMPLAAVWMLFMVCFAVRGVSLVEVIIAWIILLITAVSLATVGLVASTLSKNMTGSLLIAYGLFLPGLFLIPSLAMFLVNFILALFLFDASDLTGDVFVFSQSVIFYGWGLVACLNPFSAGVSSAVIYQETGIVFFVFPDDSFNSFFDEPIFPLPWLVYCLFYSAFSWMLIKFSTRRLTRLNRH